MELTLSNEAKRYLRNLTSALDRVAQELGKDQHQAPKSPNQVVLSLETVTRIAESVSEPLRRQP